MTGPSVDPLQDGSGVALRRAATVLLVRDGRRVEGAPTIETYMIRRPARSAAFPDLHVFPGGKVDAADEAIRPYRLPAVEADRLLGVPSGGLAYWAAAIRECFEEAGVLLAYGSSSAPRLLEGAACNALASYRTELLEGRLTMSAFCAAEQLLPAFDELYYFSHWITPEQAPRRFDTRFFVARLPAGQRTERHAEETADSDWVAPSDALARHASGAWQMISPTLTTLASIARFTTVDELLAAVRAETHLPELTEALSIEGMQRLR